MHEIIVSFWESEDGELDKKFLEALEIHVADIDFFAASFLVNKTD